MNWSRATRQAHRWLSIVFTITVVANIIATLAGRAIEWLYLVPLAPLVLMMATGLYLFFLPYAGKSTAGRPGSGEA